jgi:beta-1,4-N-acetylglucosaminyltransferase
VIFVTVGLMVGFERLIKKMDEIAKEIDEKVIMQIGYTKYLPKNSEYFKFKEVKEIQKMYLDASLIVSHAGVGSIMTALELNRPIIIVPRRKKYGECIDNHQMDIAKELENNKRIKVIYDVNELNAIIDNKDYIIYENNINIKNRLIENLRDYLERLDAKD